MSDIATAIQRTLDNNKQVKPLDFGNGGICGSVSPNGGMILLNAYHSQHGFVGLNTAPPFPFDDRYVQQKVREYRSSLVTLKGFGPRFDSEVRNAKASLIADVLPLIELTLADGSSARMTLVSCEQGVVQRWEFTGELPEFRGMLSLQRAAYTQLTEGGPLPDVSADMQMHVSNGRITLCDRNLPCTLIIDGFGHELPDRQLDTVDSIDLRFPITGSQTLHLAYTVAEDSSTAQANIDTLKHYQQPAAFDQLVQRESARWQEYLAKVADDLPLRRGLVYGRMVTIPASKDASCIMTDHMLLPLSWNRDAYFVAIAFLQWGEAHWPLVRKHLIWMFEVADRGDDNEWGRCYLVSGQAKDRAYQLDQQLFPLLQLADYVFCSGDTELFDSLKHHIQPLVDTILSRKHVSAMLFPTDETPGDDPLDYKFHFSSHLLAWHTFMMLEKLLPDSGYLEIAQQIHADTQQYFITQLGDRHIYSYATDLNDNHLFYHDANDVPLALAPEWGFVSEQDPVWRATVEFAYSPENENGYFDNTRLGSVHTPAPWPLGDVQKLIFARLLNKSKWEKQALADIQAAAQWDGGLPEAYNGDDFSIRSRNWFAWPNAFYAMSQLEKLK